MTIITGFLKRKKELLEKIVEQKFEDGILEESDSDLEALGRIAPDNTMFNMAKAFFAMPARPQEAFNSLGYVNTLRSEKIAICAILIYKNLIPEGLVSIEEFEALLEGTVICYPSAEVLKLAGEIYLREFNNHQRAYQIGKRLKEMYGDSTISAQAVKEWLESSEL